MPIDRAPIDRAPVDRAPVDRSALALFLEVLRIAFIVLQAITRRMHADLDCLTLLQGCQAAHCLYSIVRIKLTLELHPDRITAAEIRRLAKASRYINRLARRKIDFFPFFPDDPASEVEPQSKGEDPVGLRDHNPQSLFRPRLSVLRSMSASYAPGATLANVCQTLARLLKLLPDLDYDPEASVPPNTPEFPSLPHANSAPSSPLGARASSPAATLTPANPATPSPQSPCINAPP